MTELIERYIRELAVALQVARIYTTKHPGFVEAMDAALATLNEILQQIPEVTIGIIGEELAYEREIFFDLSKRIKAAIGIFKTKGIERITFKRGTDKNEFIKLIDFLAVPQEAVSPDIGAHFSSIGMEHIVVSKIKVSSSEDVELTKVKSYAEYYDESLLKLSQSIEDLVNGDKIDSLDLRFTLINVVDDLFSRYHEFLKLTALKRYDKFTFGHLVNVSILSMYFSWKLGFSKEDFLDIATAGLFHDIGKVFISRKILQKPGRLSKEETTEMKSHTILGAEILLKYSDSLGVIAPVVALEHHLRYDSKGYPRLYFSQKPHTSSLIVSICDVYDALTQRRTYKRDYPPNIIYQLMMRGRGSLFHPQLIDKFFQVLGVWPQGAILLLSNKSIAIVREQNADDIFNPIVEIVAPEAKHEFVNLKKNNNITIEKFLSPLSDGKPYLSLI